MLCLGLRICTSVCLCVCVLTASHFRFVLSQLLMLSKLDFFEKFKQLDPDASREEINDAWQEERERQERERERHFILEKLRLQKRDDSKSMLPLPVTLPLALPLTLALTLTLAPSPLPLTLAPRPLLLDLHHVSLCLVNAAITFDEAEQKFNSIALDGTYDTWPAEMLQVFSDRILVSLAELYPNSCEYDEHLHRSPSTIPESLSSVDTEEGGECTEQEIAEPLQPPGLNIASSSSTRAKLPAKLTCKCSKFSAATVGMLKQLTIEHFAAEALSDSHASRQSHLHLKIARQLIRWRFYQTANIQPYTSPSKSLPRRKPAEAKGLTEGYVQNLLSRVVFPLCKELGLTLHDARSYPKVQPFVRFVLTRSMSLTPSTRAVVP